MAVIHSGRDLTVALKHVGQEEYRKDRVIVLIHRLGTVEAIVHILVTLQKYRIAFCVGGVRYTVDSPSGRSSVHAPGHVELV